MLWDTQEPLCWSLMHTDPEMFLGSWCINMKQILGHWWDLMLACIQLLWPVIFLEVQTWRMIAIF